LSIAAVAGKLDPRCLRGFSLTLGVTSDFEGRTTAWQWKGRPWGRPFSFSGTVVGRFGRPSCRGGHHCRRESRSL